MKDETGSRMRHMEPTYTLNGGTLTVGEGHSGDLEIQLLPVGPSPNVIGTMLALAAVTFFTLGFFAGWWLL